MRKHRCKNEYRGEGARGGCFVQVTASTKEGIALLDVGHSCVVVHNKFIPVTWIAEVVAIASLHDGGIEGFLKANGLAGDDSSYNSYALMCDPKLPDGEIYTE
jgi:hypothetical protein